MGIDAVTDEYGVAGVLRYYDLNGVESIKPVSGGTANRNLKVHTGRGDFLLRKRNKKYSNMQNVMFDHSVITELYNKNLPVPSIVTNIHGHSFTIADSDVYELFTFIDGQDYETGNLEQLRNSASTIARFQKSLQGYRPEGEKAQLRYDSPYKLKSFLDSLDENALKKENREILCLVRHETALLLENLPDSVYFSLGTGIIHGDYHPFNVKFKNNEICGIFDFDWTGHQPMIRDLADGILFFACKRENAGDFSIRILTRAGTYDTDIVCEFLDSYMREMTLTRNDYACLPLVIKARWLCCRVDGTFKVPAEEKESYFFDGIHTVVDWINNNMAGILKNFIS